MDFVQRVLTRRAVVVLVSDFLGQTHTAQREVAGHLKRGAVFNATLGQVSLASLRQVRRRHDVIAVQVIDRFELELPPLGRMILKDAETGEVLEIDAGNPQRRRAFAERQQRTQRELEKLFRSAAIDFIQLRTDQPYAAALGRFFETREKRRRRG
jgi:uncharacterized protein (DUF58 family)